ncbi:MAG: flavodoxin family protein [Methanobacteriota archaeon]|nr:MAG: flavodoxin family protein [Euryarchaeota archaeon]
MTKVVTVNGSPRRKGNVDALLRVAEEELEGLGVEVERISLSDYNVKPCEACDVCSENAWECPLDDDAVPLLRKLVEADALIVGSPVYFGGVTAQLKALIDRSAIPYQKSELRGKIGAAISCGGGRHGGQELTVNQIITFFLMHEMTVASGEEGVFGAMGVANDLGDIASDEEALSSSRALARRVAELLREKGA